jgi:protein TonB
MPTARLDLPPAPPEWRHSAPYLLIALALHALFLFIPLAGRNAPPQPPPPEPIMARLVEATPIAPATPPPVAPSPPPPRPPRERPASKPRPVMAMAPAPASPPPTFSVPAAPVNSPPAMPTAAPAPSVAPAAATPARFDAAYLNNPEPNYPPASRRLGEEGKVMLRVRVTPAGLPAAVDIEKSSRFERLDEAARQAVARWRFVPARRGDEAVESSVIVPIVFRLSD